MAPTYAVVDGSNIATEGRSVPSLVQLDDAVRQFQAEFPGTEVIVVVDATFGHRIDPSERKAFDDAVAHAELVSPPAGAVGRGDAFLLRVAERVDAQVLSNDSFQEFHAEHPWLFDEGRLIGGKPVPGVGWIFTPRSPVRGVRSRAVMAAGSGKASKASKVTTRRTSTDGPRIGDSRPGRDQLLIGAAVAAAAADVVGASPERTGSTKTQKAAKAQKAAKVDKSAKTEKVRKAHKSAKTEKAAKSDKAGKAEKAGKAAKTTRAAKTTKGEKAAKAAKSSPTEKAVRKTKKTAEPAPQKAKAGKATKAQKAPAARGIAAGTPAASGGRRARGRRATAPDVRAAIVAATVEAVDPDAEVQVPEPSRRRRGGSPAAVNDPLTFLTFVSEHPIGSTVEGTVSSFVSHGAMVDVGGMQCYVPLGGFASPPPRRAREVVDRGEQRQFVLVALDPARRGAELALPDIAPRRLAR